METIIRAKIQISSVFDQKSSNEGEKFGEQVSAHAVYGGSTNSEDNTFSAATPSLNLTMFVNNKDVFGKLKQGKKYYIDFTEVPE